MDLFNEVIEFSSSSDEVYKFYDHCVAVHQTLDCTIANCDIT